MTKTFGDMLKTIREKMGLSQTVFGRIITGRYVTRQYMSQLENNAIYVSVKVATRFADKLELTGQAREQFLDAADEQAVMISILNRKDKRRTWHAKK